MLKPPVQKGLYTDKAGKVVVYVVDFTFTPLGTEVYFDNVRTGKEYTWDHEPFLKKYPNRVDKIEVEFNE